MPELFLHIGTHKTGTTSVQRFFAQNREPLRQLGIWYPEFGIADLPDHYAHHRLAHAMAGRDDLMQPDDVKRFLGLVAEQARSDERVFVSAEPLYRHVIPADGASVEEAISDEVAYERYAEVVRDCFDGFDVTVMVMLRRQDLFAESLYAEHVLSSGYRRGISEFLDERRALFDYRTRLDVWSAAFGADALAVRTFEPSTFEVPIERLFLEWLGCEWSDSLTIGRRRNVTLPRTLVEFKRMLNSENQGATVNAQYRRWLEQLSSTPAGSKLKDLGRYYLQPRERAALMDDHELGNRSVAEEFLGRTQLFTQSHLVDIAKYEDRPHLTPADFRDISKLLLRLLATA